MRLACVGSADEDERQCNSENVSCSEAFCSANSFFPAPPNSWHFALMGLVCPSSLLVLVEETTQKQEDANSEYLADVISEDIGIGFGGLPKASFFD